MLLGLEYFSEVIPYRYIGRHDVFHVGTNNIEHRDRMTLEDCSLRDCNKIFHNPFYHSRHPSCLTVFQEDKGLEMFLALA